MKEKIERVVVGKTDLLAGEVRCEGSKNSSLMCMAAAALINSDEIVTLYNVPHISDVWVFIEILKISGKKIEFKDNILRMSGRLELHDIPVNLTSSIRASSYCLGIFLSVLGEVRKLGVPGGDKIGERPLDIHLENMKKMGIEYELYGGKIDAHVIDKVYGQTMYLKFPSVGATCNLILMAVNAIGKTVILNAAHEPEIVELANMLIKMGARISGVGTDRIKIIGNTKLRGNISYTISADRIEAGTFMVIAALAGKKVTIRECIPYHNYPLLYVLESIGVNVNYDDSTVEISRGKKISPLDVIAMPFPGIPTDIQPLLTILALSIEGTSVISDLVFPDRFQYVYELIRMGAKIEKNGNKLIVLGGNGLSGKYIVGNDIRAVVALICVGLIADGITEISGVEHLERGYYHFIEKLNLIGARIFIENKKE